MPPAIVAHFMRVIRVSALIALMFFSWQAYATTPSFQCGRIETVFKNALQGGYAYLATGAEQSGFAANLFINIRTDEWQIIGVDDDLNACTILKGTDWQWVIVKQA